MQGSKTHITHKFERCKCIAKNVYNADWAGNLTDSAKDTDNFSNSTLSLFISELNMKLTPEALRDWRTCLESSLQAFEIKLTF